MYHRAVNKMVLQPTVLTVSVDLLNVLLIPVYSVSQTMVQEVVIHLLIHLPLYKFIVIPSNIVHPPHVSLYLEELILRMKQHVRVRHVILV